MYNSLYIYIDIYKLFFNSFLSVNLQKKNIDLLVYNIFTLHIQVSEIIDTVVLKLKENDL